MNFMQLYKENKCAFALLLAIGGVFYLMNVWTPEYLDDYLYKYMFVEGSANTEYPIHNLQSVFQSQADHYYSFNGRIIIHSFVQLFSGILGKSLFNVANTILFCTLLITIIKYVSFKKKDLLFALAVTAFLIVGFMPAFNQTFVWMTGSINYLWTIYFVLLYLYGIKKLRDKPLSVRSFLPVFVLGVLTGWTHEGVAFPLVFGSIVYCMLHRKSSFKSLTFPLIIGFVIGACCCAFSPATLGRAAAGSGLSISALVGKIISGVTLCFKLRVFYLLLAFVLFKKYILKQSIRKWVERNDILLLSIFFSFGIVFLSGFTSSRTAFGLEFFSLLALLSLISTLSFKEPLQKGIMVVSVGLLLIGSGVVLSYSFANYQEYKSLVRQIKTGDTYIVQSNEVSMPRFFSQYIQTPLIQESDEYYFGFSPNDGWNHFIASTYGRDSLAFIPALFLDDLKQSPEHYERFHTCEELPFYAKHIAEESVKEVTFLLRKTEQDEIPFYLRPWADRMERYSATEIETDRYAVVDIEGQHYLLVTKNAMIGHRVKDIVYK